MDPLLYLHVRAYAYAPRSQRSQGAFGPPMNNRPETNGLLHQRRRCALLRCTTVTWLPVTHTWFNLNPVSHLAHVEYGSGRRMSKWSTSRLRRGCRAQPDEISDEGSFIACETALRRRRHRSRYICVISNARCNLCGFCFVPIFLSASSHSRIFAIFAKYDV